MAPRQPPPSGRLTWLDGVRGVSIIWIVFFHFFNTWSNGRYPSLIARHFIATISSRCAEAGFGTRLECWSGSLFAGVEQLGFHAVGVFILMSGLGLTYAIANKPYEAANWPTWYRSRIVRLYPMYWLAHLIYLVSPFVARPEPIDYRFLLSFLGDRDYPIEMIFYYFNPALWYFGLLIQLYIVFPILFWILQRAGNAWFLIICAAATIVSRYILLSVIGANGDWVQGGFFACRLWEFAAGMVLGMQLRQRTAAVQQLLFSGATLVAGIAIYIAGIYSYNSLITYTLSDALTGTGMFVILVHVVRMAERLPRLGARLARVGAYSYGIYLLHQPYVIFLGQRVRGLNMIEFAMLAAVVITVIAAVCMPLERYVNELTNRVFNRVVGPVAVRAAG